MDFIKSDFMEITISALAAIIFLFILAKLTGPRQIAQLTFYDYVVGISVGSIAASLAIDTDLPFWLGLWAMAIFSGISIAMSYFGNKSIYARRIFSGTPKVFVFRGQIIEKNLKRQNYDINDLLMACRSSGYFDLNDLEFVIMETTGQLSFLPKSEKAPLTPSDMNLQPSFATLQANVIIDGNIMTKHLRAIGQDEAWLRQRLAEEDIRDIKTVLLATADIKGNFRVYKAQRKSDEMDLFE